MIPASFRRGVLYDLKQSNCRRLTFSKVFERCKVGANRHDRHHDCEQHELEKDSTVGISSILYTCVGVTESYDRSRREISGEKNLLLTEVLGPPSCLKILVWTC